MVHLSSSECHLNTWRLDLPPLHKINKYSEKFKYFRTWLGRRSVPVAVTTVALTRTLLRLHGMVPVLHLAVSGIPGITGLLPGIPAARRLGVAALELQVSLQLLGAAVDGGGGGDARLFLLLGGGGRHAGCCLTVSEGSFWNADKKSLAGL